MTSHLIMVSGKQGAGKSTLCDNLGKALADRGYQIVRTRFAGPLYEMHDAVLKIARRYGIMTKDKDGPLLQLIGTEWGRKTVSEDVWVNCMRTTYAHYQKLFHHLPLVMLVEDLRFINEFEAFPDAIRIRLSCPKGIRYLRTNSWRENDLHPSEVDLDEHETTNKFDLTLSTALHSLETTLASTMEYLRERGLCGDPRGLKVAD